MRIPKLWIKYLKEVQEVCPDAIIAGGCLRDLKCGLDLSQVKDVDIFLPSPTQAEIDQISARYKTTLTRDIKGTYGNLSNADIAAILTVATDEQAIEIIGMNVPKESVMDRFDIGLCQIWYDGKEIRTTDSFKRDQSAKSFTLLRCDNYEQYTRSRSRCEKFILGKYQGYSFNDNGFAAKYGVGVSFA